MSDEPIGVARLVEPSGAVLLGIAIVSFVLSLKNREAFRGREPS